MKSGLVVRRLCVLAVVVGLWGCGPAPSALDAQTWKQPPLAFQKTLMDACLRAESPELGACVSALHLYEQRVWSNDQEKQNVLERACGLGYEQACINLAQLKLDHESDDVKKQAIQDMIAACDRGFSGGCVAAQEGMYWAFNEPPADLPSPDALSARGCEMGQASACERVAWRIDIETPEQWNLAFAAWERACGLGSTDACLMQARILAHSQASKASLSAAADMLDRLCASSSEACVVGLFVKMRAGEGWGAHQKAFSARCLEDAEACRAAAERLVIDEGYSDIYPDWPFEERADAHVASMTSDAAYAAQLYQILCDGAEDDYNVAADCFALSQLEVSSQIAQDAAQRACAAASAQACVWGAQVADDPAKSLALFQAACEESHFGACQVVALHGLRLYETEDTGVVLPDVGAGPPTFEEEQQVIFGTLSRMCAPYASSECEAFSVSLLDQLVKARRRQGFGPFAPFVEAHLVANLRLFCHADDQGSCESLVQYYSASPLMPSNEDALYFMQRACYGDSLASCSRFVLAAAQTPQSKPPTKWALDILQADCDEDANNRTCLTLARHQSLTGGVPGAQALLSAGCALEDEPPTYDEESGLLFDESNNEMFCGMQGLLSVQGAQQPGAADSAREVLIRGCFLGSGDACYLLGLSAYRVPAAHLKAFAQQALLTFDWDFELDGTTLVDPQGAAESQALSHYEQRCAEGEAYYCQHGAYLAFAQKDIEKARQLLAQGCQASPLACVSAAGLTASALGSVKADLAAAFVMNKSACDHQESRRACVLVGLASLSGLGTNKNPEAASQDLWAGCDEGEGDALGCYLLADLFARGVGVLKDPEAAKTLKGYACEGGLGEACAQGPKR